MQKEFNLREKRGLGQSVSDTFDYFKIHFKPLMKIVLFVAGPIFLVASILMGLFYFNLGNQMLAKDMNFYSSASTAIISAAEIFIGLLLFGVGAVVLNGLVVEYMKLSLTRQKQDIALKDVTDALKKRFGYYLLSTFLIILFIFIGAFIFIIPAIYLSIVFSLYFPIMAIENKNTGDALGRCFSLMGGFWWKSIILFSLMGLIQSAFSYTVSIPFIAYSFTDALSNTDVTQMAGNLYVSMAIYMPVLFLANSLSYTLSAVAAGVNYFSIVEHKEEVGLKERIEAIGGENEE